MNFKDVIFLSYFVEIVIICTNEENLHIILIENAGIGSYVCLFIHEFVQIYLVDKMLIANMWKLQTSVKVINQCFANIGNF